MNGNSKDYVNMLENGLVNALGEIADLSEKLGKEFDYYDKLRELTGLSNYQALNILDNGNMVQIVEDNLTALKEKNENYNYEIESDFSDFIHYINIGRTAKEKLQIFIMCYVVKPKIRELEEWTLYDLINYIKETDTEFYEEDKTMIYECSMEIIKDYDNFEEEKQKLIEIIYN